MCQIETHPFEAYVPNNIKVLIIGSFPGREQAQNAIVDPNDWFYGSKRNQFWTILSAVYNTKLVNKQDKQALFEAIGIGITDIFYQIIRQQNNNSDTNLQVIAYNVKPIQKVLSNYPNITIFFTSKFVEKQFRKCFPNTTYTECLPSPSPRYATMSLTDKINHYKVKLPKLEPVL